MRRGLEPQRVLGARDDRPVFRNAMVVQKYDIRRALEHGGGFEERYWSPVNSPILAQDGTVGEGLFHAESIE